MLSVHLRLHPHLHFQMHCMPRQRLQQHADTGSDKAIALASSPLQQAAVCKAIGSNV